MIGDGWDGDPAARPASAPGEPRRIAVVTGSRAEFGLLRPVMHAIASRADLQLMVIAAGSHLMGSQRSYYEIKAEFNVAEIVPMQETGATGRAADVQAVGRGVARFGRAFEKLGAEWVVVLGDRIEAFAAAAAASIGGFALAHIHGGDRAEGIADEAMRHAITKLAHAHFAASEASAARLRAMGELSRMIFNHGSPAIDDLAGIPPLSDATFNELGAPSIVLLLHPVGRTPEMEEAAAAAVIEGLSGERVLALSPNLDAGRDGIARALTSSGLPLREHLPRAEFIGLLRRLAAGDGVLVGNSSAALIEGAALRVPAVDIGPRQAGRERCGNVVHAERESAQAVAAAVARARMLDRSGLVHPYGDGRAGERIAATLATLDPREPGLTRKRCAY